MAGKSKGQRTEDALLQAAREVFARNGYFNAKIADIARAAGRSPGSFYNYYENKEQLLDALLEQFGGEVTHAALSARSDDPYESVRGAVTAYWTAFRQHVPEMIGLFQLSMTDESYAARWRAVRGIGVRGVIGQLEAARDAGHLEDVDIPTMASAIVSMLESFSWTWLAGKGDKGVEPPDDDTAIDTLTAMWFGAVYGPAAARRGRTARSGAS
ncbi:TetR/AcrR family transcriptional regulator [Gordonia sp. CPCC 206044]|uniref:TetR/AcrR family transcriptional regulator n=1 Tax=Gordonia sp. CPCC 206044 TaxID=3140793 RepID=UPI003AF3D755